MNRTTQGVDARDLPFVPLEPGTATSGPSPDRVRRRAPGPRWALRRVLGDLRHRCSQGDGALLVLCVLLMLATIAGAVGLVLLAT